MRILTKVLLVILVAFFGIAIRLDDYVAWSRNPPGYFFRGNPLFTGMDSFYYARIAKKLLAEWKTKGLRAEKILRIQARGPALLSALISYETGSSIEKTSIWFSPVAVSISTLPLIAFGVLLGSWWIGLLASVMLLSSPIVIHRTPICWLDTDPLNIVFPIMLSLSIAIIGEKKNPIFLIISILLFVLSGLGWKWWYGHGYLLWGWVASAIVVITIRLIMESKELLAKKKEASASHWTAVLMYTAILTCGVAVAVGKITYLINTAESLLRSYGQRGWFYQYKDLIPIVPVAELTRTSLIEIAYKTCGAPYTFAAAVMGALLLATRKPLQFIALAPLIALGAASLKAGIRFSMYWVPVLSLSLSFLVYSVYKALKSKGKSKVATLISLLAPLMILLGNRISLTEVAKPLISPQMAAAMSEIGKATPKGSVILSWWDMGYPIQYYSGRRTMTDGGNQNPYIIYLTAVALSSYNLEDAHKALNILTDAPSRSMFFKRLKTFKALAPAMMSLKPKRVKRKLYLFLSSYMLRTVPVMFTVGRWDFLNNKGPSPIVRTMLNCKKLEASMSCEGLTIDMKNYVVNFEDTGEVKPIKRTIVIRNGEVIYERERNPTGVLWIVVEKPPVIYPFIVDEAVYESAFGKLFFKHKSQGNFKLVHQHFPGGVLYRVE